MKYLFIIGCCILSSFALAQSKIKPVSKTTAKSAAPVKTEMARLIKTKVLIRDSSSIQTVMNNYGDPSSPIAYHITDTYINYLEPSYYYEFKQNIYKIAHSKSALIFSGWDLKKPLTWREIFDKYAICDSLDEISIDPEGNEIITKVFRCDSTSKIENVSAINFFESWTFNESSGMIEKDVLAYEILSFHPEKRGYMILFMVVKDEEARKKLIRLYFGN
jgi:hypothetical protein